MRWFILIMIISFVGILNLEAYRIPRPHTFSVPFTQQQANFLNDAFEDLWNLQNGEFNFDIVTTTKSGANEGDAWILNDGGVFKWEYMAGGSVRTVTPD